MVLAPHPGTARTQPILGRGILLAAAGIFLAISLPVVVRGAPLADDFTNCLLPLRRGLDGFAAASFDRLGAVRPARFVEILVTTGVCRSLPFGVAIAVPLVLTMAVALLLRTLLRQLAVPSPWPEIGAALWLAQPLGAESALWPAALHVPLALSAALAAVLLHRGGHWAVATLAAVVAMLSAEQTILALPLLVWLAMPDADESQRRRRQRATLLTTGTAAAALLAVLLAPGNDVRLQVGLVQRLQGLIADPAFYVLFPAVGLGLESIPLALRWAFPLSVLVVAGAATAGWRWAPQLLEGRRAEGRSSRPSTAAVIAAVALLVLINLPVVLNVPQQGSPRVFAPTWLLLSGVVAAAGWRVRWHRPALVGALVAGYLAGAALSLALSAWVRVETADFVQRGAETVAAQTDDGDVVVLCDVPRAAVSPAPRGAFAVHDYLYDWSSGAAVEYYTGRTVSFLAPTDAPGCDGAGADLALPFESLSPQTR